MPLRALPREALLHARQFRIATLDLGDNRFVVRGTLEDYCDQALAMPTGDDIPPGMVHNITLDLTIVRPDFTIVKVKTIADQMPMDTCFEALPDLQKLVGLKVARGFNTKARQLLGGAQSCTHYLELLLNMAKVVRVANRALLSSRHPGTAPNPAIALKFLNNTCLAWAEDGSTVRYLRQKVEEMTQAEDNTAAGTGPKGPRSTSLPSPN